MCYINNPIWLARIAIQFKAQYKYGFDGWIFSYIIITYNDSPYLSKTLNKQLRKNAILWFNASTKVLLYIQSYKNVECD